MELLGDLSYKSRRTTHEVSHPPSFSPTSSPATRSTCAAFNLGSFLRFARLATVRIVTLGEVKFLKELTEASSNSVVSKFLMRRYPRLRY